ncbi:HXXEE domain-containing protein [Sanguibacter sp. HDW7]|uniref:HXXEE domain-containing protein n=1 Tax=Sanguibacter sp. HDW7 TaxID=2714931 RepID=UPI00140C2AEE|nr:HXXEE domain-containing protein [Sanguibacter sp. HDW7]QIK83892.1 HXXEE domain-containing protein [Sanguibacter sp. HDW7]
MPRNGPSALLLAWALHDVEEAMAFPVACERAADATGVEHLRTDHRQSWIAVGLMGVLVAAACRAGAAHGGGSRVYRAVVAGLGAHVVTHVGASAAQRAYTPGIVTALPIMLPGAAVARRELAREGTPLCPADYVRGAALLVPAALACHILARLVPASRRRPAAADVRRWR